MLICQLSLMKMAHISDKKDESGQINLEYLQSIKKTQNQDKSNLSIKSQ